MSAFSSFLIISLARVYVLANGSIYNPLIYAIALETRSNGTGAEFMSKKLLCMYPVIS